MCGETQWRGEGAGAADAAQDSPGVQAGPPPRACTLSTARAHERLSACFSPNTGLLFLTSGSSRKCGHPGVPPLQVPTPHTSESIHRNKSEPSLGSTLEPSRKNIQLSLGSHWTPAPIHCRQNRGIQKTTRQPHREPGSSPSPRRNVRRGVFIFGKEGAPRGVPRKHTLRSSKWGSFSTLLH